MHVISYFLLMHNYPVQCSCNIVYFISVIYSYACIGAGIIGQLNFVKKQYTQECSQQLSQGWVALDSGLDILYAGSY